MQNSSISTNHTIINYNIPSSTITSSSVSNDTTTTTTNNCEEGVEISISDLHLEPPHELCLDDLIKDDSYEKLIKGNSNNNIVIENQQQQQHQFIPILNTLENSSFCNNSSVLDEYHHSNLTTISSHYGLSNEENSNNFNTNYHSALETINEDSIKELLGSLR
jgi:hypothetical protein